MRAEIRKLLAVKAPPIHGIIMWEVHQFQVISTESIRNLHVHTLWRPQINAKSFNSCYSPVATSFWHLVWSLKMASQIDKPSYSSEHPDPESSIKECAITLPLCHFVNVSLNNDCYLASNAVYPDVHSPLRSCLQGDCKLSYKITAQGGRLFCCSCGTAPIYTSVPGTHSQLMRCHAKLLGIHNPFPCPF